MIGVFISFLAAIVVFPLIYIILGMLFRKRANEKYSFRSYFPYEMFSNIGHLESVVLRVFQSLALVAGLLPAIYCLVVLLTIDPSSMFYFVALSIAYLIPMVSFLSLTLIPVSFPKQHMTLFFTFAAGEILSSCMSGFYLITMYGRLSSSSLLAIAIVLFFLSFLVLLLTINPKMKTWDHMDKVANPDGTTSFARPKWFVLAYSSWGIYFISVCTAVLSEIGFYLCYFTDL